MSDDRRPGKVRVVASSLPALGPRRRRGDLPQATNTETGSDIAAPEARGFRLLRVLLFLTACAAGGVLTALFDLFGAIGR